MSHSDLEWQVPIYLKPYSAAGEIVTAELESMYRHHLGHYHLPAEDAAAGAVLLWTGAGACLGTLLSDMRFATAGTGGEAALPGGPPKEASSCSNIFGFKPGGSCFFTAFPTLPCTCRTCFTAWQA